MKKMFISYRSLLILLDLLVLSTIILGQSSKQNLNVISSGGNSTYVAGTGISYTIGQYFVGSASTSNNTLNQGFWQYYDQTKQYQIGEIPDQTVWHGSTLRLYVDVPNGIIINVEGPSTVTFNQTTKTLEYTPDANDFSSFEVKLSYKLGNEIIGHSFTITPLVQPVYAGNNDFGFTHGSFDVSEGGSMSYSIPIALPPATGGVSPDLALVYSSTASNGILGIGWNIAGLSVIGREGANYAQDNKTDGVDFDALDRFTLDGERLVVAGGGVYGANGTEYRTEQNSQQKIISYVEGGVTAKFIVYTKDGLIKEYGFTDDSRIEAQYKKDVLFWALNKISDRFGNYIVFKYSENKQQGEFYPTEILFTANDNAGLQATNKVVFNYTSRQDPIQNYVYGSKVAKSKRMTSIIVYGGNSIYREYSFDYANDVYSKLITLREAGLNGQVNKPVHFYWQNNIPFKFADYTDIADAELFKSNLDISQLDLNYDGYVDFLFFDKVTGNNTWLINDGKMNFSKHENLISASSLAGFTDIIIGDYNGDAYPDILAWKKATGENKIFRNLKNLSFNISKYSISNTEIDGGNNIFTGDWNNDGLTDLLWYDQTNGFNMWYLNISNESNDKDLLFYNINAAVSNDAIKGGTALYLNDWNGDGSTDLMWYDKTNGENKWFLNNGFTGNQLEFTNETKNIPHEYLTGGSGIYFGDWNADGLPDIMWFDNQTGKNNWIINRGDLSFESTVINPVSKDMLKEFGIITYLADWNGDGLTDIMVNDYQTGNNTWFLNRGHFKFSATSGLITPDDIKEGAGLMYGDWTGIGTNGVMWYDPTTGKNRWYVNETTNSNLINKIVEGNGFEMNIEYSNLHDSKMYTPHKSGSYPDIDFIGTVSLVNKYSISNGIGGFTDITYHYEGAKYNLRGRGFRGFAKVTETNHSSQIQTIYNYNRDFRLVGNQLLSIQTKSLNGNLLGEESFQSGYLEEKGVFFSFLKYKQTKEYGIDGSLIKDVSTAMLYDEFGNQTRCETIFGDGQRIEIQKEYSNNKADWIIGKLTRKTELFSKSGSNAQSKITEYAIHPTYGVISSEVTLANTDLQLISRFEYDKVGNVVKKTFKGNDGLGINERVSTWKFDDSKRFPVEISNSLGHREIRTYNNTTGLLISQTDPNGLQTRWLYDGFNRIIKEIQPNGIQVSTVYMWVKQGDDVSDNASYVVYTQTMGAPDKRIYYDKLNREISIQLKSFDNQWICVSTEYDINGRETKKSLPYYLGSGVDYTQTDYNIKGDIVSVIEPGGRQTSYGYSGLSVTETNPNGNKTISQKTQSDKITKISDANGGSNLLEYDSKGNLTKLVDANGNINIYQYDDANNMIVSIDPDFKKISYRYNAFKEKIWQQNNAGQVMTFSYDLIGRLVRQETPEGNTIFLYDQADNGVGLLFKSISDNGDSKTYSYSKYGEIAVIDEQLSGDQFITTYTYDQYGRINEVKYPGNSLTIKNSYTNTGYLLSVSNKTSGDVYWQAENMTARGQVDKFILGNGVETTKTYDKETNDLLSILSNKNNLTIQNLNYEYDKVGNLVSRIDNKYSLEENFVFDNINRLKKSIIGNRDTISIEYDKAGNISYKSDVGIFTYGENGENPYSVTSINNIDYDLFKKTFGLNGNVRYTSFNKVSMAMTDSLRLQIHYDYSLQRNAIEIYSGSNLLCKKLYIGNYYEKEFVGDSVINRYFVRASEGVVCAIEKSENNYSSINYWHKDHIGSLQCITDTSGSIIQEYSYDAWGKRRNPITWKEMQAHETLQSKRGFTGHEHYDIFSLIDMNGRMYDPVIGRFLSPDIYVQDVYNTQAINRYSYCMNNPLTIVDPSGYFSIRKKFEKTFKSASKSVKKISNSAVKFASDPKAYIKKHEKEAIMIAAIGAGIATGGLAAAPFTGTLSASIASGAGFGFGMSASSTLMSGGDLKTALKTGGKQAIISGISAGATFGIGELGALIDPSVGHGTSMLNIFPKSILHGTVQGIVTEYEGGNFKNGFISGAAATISAPTLKYLSNGSVVVQVTGSAIVGGYSSKFSGGNFQQGAINAGFVTFFNDNSGKVESKSDSWTEDYGRENKEYIKKNLNNTLWGNVKIWSGFANYSVNRILDQIIYPASEPSLDLKDELEQARKK